MSKKGTTKKHTAEQERIAALKLKFLEYFRELPLQNLAAAHIGRDQDTISSWKATDTEFSEQIRIAKSAWALKNVKGVRSKEWLLERIMRDDFAQRQELTGKGGKDLPTPILNIDTNVSSNNSDKKD